MPVNGDRTGEPNETFVINLGQASGGAVIADGQGVGTILDDEPRVAINDVSKNEGDSGMTQFVIHGQPIACVRPSGKPELCHRERIRESGRGLRLAVRRAHLQRRRNQQGARRDGQGRPEAGSARGLLRRPVRCLRRVPCDSQGTGVVRNDDR